MLVTKVMLPHRQDCVMYTCVTYEVTCHASLLAQHEIQQFKTINGSVYIAYDGHNTFFGVLILRYREETFSWHYVMFPNVMVWVVFQPAY